MISGIDLNGTSDYTLKDDKTEPTTWKLGTFSSYIHAKIGGMNQKDSAGNAFTMAQLGIRGWENFKIAGVDVKFETETQTIFDRQMEVVPMKLIELIPLTALMELVGQILKNCGLGADEQKN